MRIIVDGSTIRTESDLHHYLSEKLDFGPYYGNNLSALWDRLSTDVERPVELIWEHSDVSNSYLGDERFDKIVSILNKVMEQDREFGWIEKFVVSFR